MNNENEQLEHRRHTLAHLLASAVKKLYPDAKNTIGPAIDNGFYYDFEFSTPITESDLKDIQREMRKSLSKWECFKHLEVSPEEAKNFFADNLYKLELIDEIVKKGEKITLYYSGPKDFDFSSLSTIHYPLSTGFIDLCRGGHIEEPSKEITADSFKLTRLAGAYWRGDEKNKMLTRIYGLAFENKEALENYEKMMAEAEKRDHRKLGKEMKLFTVSELIGAGLPLMQPKGMVIRKEIEDYLWELHKNEGYSRVWTPHIAKEALYVASGHAAKFGDNLFRVQGKEEKFIMKPMNCPHHMQIFADNQFSYRDMPVRYFEPATVYRDEKSGQLGGLTRVRAITQDDGHLFCRIEQIEEEVSTIVNIIKKFYTTMGMMEGYWVSLSVRGDDKSMYLGTDEAWNTAENSLEKSAKDNGLNYKRVEGEAAFYGPKLDFMFKDAIGREWQLATIQCDFNLPERFDLSFINEKSEKERPVVIHRAISGSLERFMGVMIEHFAGHFPLWLSPVQVKILPISDDEISTAKEFGKLLQENNIRFEIAGEAESLGKKIRDAKIAKVPYLAVIGKKEVEEKTVTLEGKSGSLGAMSLEKAIEILSEEIKNRKF